MTLKDRPVFLQRTSASWEAHRRQARAVGTCVTYGLDDLRALVERHLTQGLCPHCGRLLTATDFAIGHKVPIARGGKFTFRNLDVCCRECAACKNVLDAQEFRELVLLLRTWPKPVQRQFRARLAAADAVIAADLPRPGSLEWVTGAEQPYPPAAPRHHKPTLRPAADTVSLCPEENPHEVHHD